MYKYLIFLLLIVFSCSKDRFSTPVTVEVINITDHSAQVVGYYCDGNSNTSSSAFCYSTEKEPSLLDSVVRDIGEYSPLGVLTNLTPGTTYYVRCFAKSSKTEVHYGNVLSFSTLERHSFTDNRDGQIYSYVKIGQQDWMAENLNFNAVGGSWRYDNDSNIHEKRYGRLYNWYAACNSCPEGWKLPSDSDWIKLEIYLGIDTTSANSFGFRGYDQAYKLKEVGYTDWIDNILATNATGFSALAAGEYTLEDKTFTNIHAVSFFWTNTSYNSEQAIHRKMTTTKGIIDRELYNKNDGLSVRCIKK